MTPEDRLIVALDFPDRARAMKLVEQLNGTVRWFKVGLELYVSEGRSIVEDLRSSGFEVFLDLKLHDIPNTVAGAVRTASASGASLITLHASGGPAMLAAACGAAASLSAPPRLLAVTVLTSMDTTQLAATGIVQEPVAQVLRLAEMAVGAGVDGLVCSPREVAAIRTSSAAHALLVVPGIRPADAALDDQSRIATPGDAVRLGADMLVVGRPIAYAADPAAMALRVLTEMAAASQ